MDSKEHGKPNIAPMTFGYFKEEAKPADATPGQIYGFRARLDRVSVANPDSLEDEVKVTVIIDSGSEKCFFRAEVGELIGLDIRAGKRGEMFGALGKCVDVYYHRIRLGIGGYCHYCYAGFSYQNNTNTLGQVGFFDIYRVEFDLPNEQFTLTVADPSKVMPVKKDKLFDSTLQVKKESAPTD